MDLLILDKDGTLVVPKSGKVFCDSPWDQKPIDGVQELLEGEYKLWRKIIVSNQGGVEAGHKTLENAILEMRFCLELFPQIEEAFFCPDFSGSVCYRVWGNCSEDCRIRYGVDELLASYLDRPDFTTKACFRKPDSGMLDLTINLFSPQRVTMIGDREEDRKAANFAGYPVDFFWASDKLLGGYDDKV